MLLSCVQNNYIKKIFAFRSQTVRGEKINAEFTVIQPSITQVRAFAAEDIAVTKNLIIQNHARGGKYRSKTIQFPTL